ncbi:hypothetical protein [Microcoleus vaginatus]
MASQIDEADGRNILVLNLMLVAAAYRTRTPLDIADSGATLNSELK